MSGNFWKKEGKGKKREENCSIDSKLGDRVHNVDKYIKILNLTKQTSLFTEATDSSVRSTRSLHKPEQTRG